MPRKLSIMARVFTQPLEKIAFGFGCCLPVRRTGKIGPTSAGRNRFIDLRLGQRAHADVPRSVCVPINSEGVFLVFKYSKPLYVSLMPTIMDGVDLKNAHAVVIEAQSWLPFGQPRFAITNGGMGVDW